MKFHAFAPGNEVYLGPQQGYAPACRRCGKPRGGNLAHLTGHDVWTAIIVAAVALLCIVGFVTLADHFIG